MRFVHGLATALLICAPLSAQPRTAGSAAVEGVVKGAKGAVVTVRLLPVDANPVRYYDGYEVSARENGRFYFADIKPGTYRITAKADGYMLAPSSKETGAVLTLHAHQKRRGITIRMVTRRELCGRVTENGAPKKSFLVAFRYNKEFGTLNKTYLPATGTYFLGTSGDGSYRFEDLPAGTYYLEAYMTWYPGSFSFNGAKPVLVGPGRTQCTLNIPLQPTVCRAFKVSGRVAPSATNDHQKYMVDFLQPNVNGGSAPDAGSSLKVSAGGKFTTFVCPGDYDLVLSDPNGVKVTFDSQHIRVGQKGVTGVVLTPRAMASIAGVVHFEGISRYESCPGVAGQQVRILREGDGQYQESPLDSKNHFEFHDVGPGNYRIYLGPFLREAVYVKSILVDGKAAEGRRFAIAQAKPVRIDITLSGDLVHAAGHIPPDLRKIHRWEVAWTRPKGTVSGEVEGNTAGVSLELRSARYNSQNSAEYTSALGPKGSFHFNDVDPGVYTLRAEGKDSFKYEYGARGLERKGTPIVVARGARIKGIRLKLPQLSSICGNVTDANGAPKSETPVYIETIYAGYLHGRKGKGEVRTDAEGRFRVNGLLPGDYFLGFPFGSHLVFFSSDGSMNAAHPIRLHANESIGCRPQSPLELRVPPGISEIHKVSGQVVGKLSPKLGDRLWATLQWDVPDAQTFVARAKLDSEHRFLFNGVPNGRFILQLHSAYGPPPRAWSGPYGPVSHLLATQTLEVRGSDVLGVKVKPMDLPTVTGTVRVLHVPTNWKHFDLSTYYVTLVPRTYKAPFSAKLSADGSFSLGPEDIGDYEINLQLRPPLYIRSVRLNGREIQGRYFHLSAQASAHLEVEVDDNSGRVDATMVPDPSMPRPDPPVREPCANSSLFAPRLPLAWPQPQIVLFPDPLFPAKTNAASSLEPRLFRGGLESDGHRTWLQVSGVPPGHYRAVAAEHLRLFSYGRAHDLTANERGLWSDLAALGQPVTVGPRARLQITLTNKSVEVARLAARFGVPLDSGVLNATLYPSM